MKSNAIAKIATIATPKVTKVAESVKVSPKALNSYAQGKAQYAELMARPYGTEGHTFGDAIDHAASSYVGILRQKKNILGKLREIGILLIELRSITGKSDKDFGQLIKTTPLSKISRQDRSDAMWLAENWADVQSFMKDMDISSCSAAYLRQKIRKASTPVESAHSDKVTAGDSKGSDEDSTVESDSEKQEIIADSVDTFAVSVATIAKAQGFDLPALISALQKIA
jgi:hypothetical protein